MLFPFCTQVLQIFRKFQISGANGILESKNAPLIKRLDRSPSQCPVGWVWSLPCSQGSSRVTAPEVLPKVFLSRHLLVSSLALTASCCTQKMIENDKMSFFGGGVTVLFPPVPAALLCFILRNDTSRCGWHLDEQRCEESCLYWTPNLLTDIKVTKNTLSSILT